tara:strand:- start:82 stop:1836 length:1755 start_codon:yes stop_codon:yes gene_type:complete
VKLTREILKRMVFNEAKKKATTDPKPYVTDFEKEYKQSSFSSPTLPVPSMIRRKNPNYDPVNRPKEPEFLPFSPPEEYSESFINFVNSQSSMKDKILAINSISEAITRKDFDAFAKALKLPQGSTDKDQTRIILNSCLVMDFMSHIAREQDSQSGGYLFEGLTALLVGGSISGGEGLAHDAVGPSLNGQPGVKYSSKWIKLEGSSAQKVSGFGINDPVTYLIAQKYSQKPVVHAGKDTSSKDFEKTPQGSVEYTKGDPKRGTIYGTADAIEVTTFSLFMIRVNLKVQGTTNLTKNQLDQYNEHLDYEKDLVALFQNPYNPKTNKNKPQDIQQKIDDIEKKYYGGVGKAPATLMWKTIMNNPDPNEKMDPMQTLNWAPNQDFVSQIVSAIKNINRPQILAQIQKPTFEIHAIDKSGNLISLQNVDPKYGNVSSKRNKQGGRTFTRKTYVKGDKPAYEGKDFFSTKFSVLTGGKVNWTIELKGGYTSVQAFLRHEAARINLVSSSGQLLKDELAATFQKEDSQSSLKDMVKQCYDLLVKYFTQMDESEKLTRSYLATGNPDDAKDSLDSIQNSGFALRDLVGLLKI